MTDPRVIEFVVGCALGVAIYREGAKPRAFRIDPKPRPVDREDLINHNAPGGSWNNKNR